MAIQQSGDVTPGHLAKWIANGVLGDAGANPYSQRVLGSLLNADFNSTSDQAIELPSSLQAFQLTGIIVSAASISLTLAAGGFYPLASKGGSPIVAAAQSYSSLTMALLLMNPTLTAYAQANMFTRSQLEDWAIYFSLTTAQGVAATGNIYLLGIELL